MSRIILMHPNKIDDATLSGGSWEPNSGLANIKDRVLNKRAQSTSLSTSDTTIDITFPSSVRVMGIAVIGHNIRPDATWTVQAFSDSGRTTETYSNGGASAWISPLDENRDWSENEWWKGRPTPSEVDDINWPLVDPIEGGHTERYWRITFNDQSNSDGYITLGRIFIGFGWQPSQNFANGQFGWVPDDEITQAFSGTEFFRERKPYRQFTPDFELLNFDQGFSRAQELFRKARNSREVFVMPDPQDDTHLNRWSFLGRIEGNSLGGLEPPAFFNQSFTIKELR